MFGQSEGRNKVYRDCDVMPSGRSYSLPVTGVGYAETLGSVARANGTYPKLLTSLAKTEVLVLDDFRLAKLSAENRCDLLEIIEDRHAARSTIVTSQLPIEKWHSVVGDPTLADAILDRLVHSAYQFNLKGDSMRNRRRPLTQTDYRST